MATELELMKISAELLGVSHAKATMKIRIHEMKLEIERLLSHVEVQAAKEEELKIKISEAEKSLKA